MAETKTYTRLTRNSAGIGTYSSLWMGSDHLLIVSSTGYSETYARVMFRDIKALFLTATNRRLWWGIPWGVIAAISGIRIVFVFANSGRPIGSGIAFALSAVALTLNWTLGGGCRVHMMTGVQNSVLPSLIRVKKTRAVLARLRPLIEASQADRMPKRAEGHPEIVAGAPAVAPQPADAPAAPPPKTSAPS